MIIFAYRMRNFMDRLNFAAIDIGSNAVRLLIKGIYPGESVSDLSKVFIVRVPLRLGQDTFTKGRISTEKTEKLLRLMHAFSQLMQVYNVLSYRACATSAMRDSSNGADIVRYISERSGINIEIINGLEEARIVYDSHIVDELEQEGDFIYVDVGGGSTEISLISGGVLQSSRSYDIGTVRLLEGRVKEESVASLRNDMRELGAGHPGLRIIGSGGNINKLYRLAAAGCKNGMELPVSELSVINGVLKSMSSEERVRVFRMRPDRADVITFAADIFLEIAGQCGVSVILVPTIGLADGIIDSLYAEDAERAGRR